MTRTLATVTGRHGMVTSPHYLATEAGLDILREGGNAAEASIAVAATLAAVYPHMTGIGGDGFWLIAEPDGRVHAIHGVGAAAARADLAYYAAFETIPTRGPMAANTVAGTISAWRSVRKTAGGTLPLKRLLRHAIHHADTGVAITPGGAAIAAAKSFELRGHPGSYAAIFEPEERPLRAGESLRQPALAATLRMLAKNGLEDFYAGETAALIAEDLAALGSPLTHLDLTAHGATRPRPLHADIAGARLYNTAPPTQGCVSLLILALFEKFSAGAADGFDRPTADKADGFAHVHGLVEATKQAFLLRDRHAGDPAHHGFDWQALLDDAMALTDLAGRIDPTRALPWPQPPQWGDTCWFAAADGEGRVVSAIQSTYFEFGSGLVLPQTGIVWQNRGSSFRLAAGGWNALKPGRKPFHTLNPALARFADGRIMAYGTMGGEGQPQTQAALFTRYARHGIDLQRAISAPRWLLGRTWGEQSTTLKLEDGFDEELYAALAAAGHDVERIGPLSATMGHAGAIVRHPDGRLEGATDPRSDGRAAAW